MILKSNKAKFFLIAFLILFSSSFLFAQNDDSDWFWGKEISSISFEGLKSVKKSDVSGVTNSFIGKQFTEELFNEALDRLYSLAFFEEIEPYAKHDPRNREKVLLVFSVKEHPVISSISFKGNKKLRNNELREAVSIKTGDVYIESVALLDERSVRDAYIKKGYSSAKVTMISKETDYGIDVTFQISEGAGTVVSQISFSGNTTFSSKTLRSKLTLKEEEQHFFQQVPVADYENNNNRIGDFENVITLIDAYDKANSDTANDFEYFTNALLVVSGVVMSDDEAGPLDFKNNRVLNFADTTSKAEYLLKDINDTALENYKNRLNADIHKFSNVVDMTDENFSGNLSGIALKYKFSGMENVTGIKEAKFKKGLMRRLELIIAVTNIKLNSLFTYTEIKPVFTRNLPTNESELVTMAKSLYGIVSEDTVLSLLPFIEDVQDEKDAIAKEKEEAALSLVDYQFNQQDDLVEGEDDEQ